LTALFNNIRYLILMCCTFCCLFISPAGFARENNDRVDEIFQLLDAGLESSEKVEQYMIELPQLIDPEDIERQQKLLAHQCWNQKADTPEQLKLATDFAIRHEALYAKSAPSALHTDLVLCKAYHLEISGRIDEAMVEFNNAVNEAYRIENPKLIADALSLRGEMLSFHNDFTQALEDLITAQSLYEKLNYTYWANSNLNNLATSYRRMGDPKTAIQYFLELEKIHLANNEHEEAIGISLQIAYALEEQNKHEQALERYRENYQYWHNKGNDLLAGISGVHLAGNLLKLNQTQEALDILAQIQAAITPNDPNAYAYSQLYLAQGKLAKGAAEEALSNIKLGEDAFVQAQDSRGLAELYKLKASVLAKLLRWEQAYQTRSEYLVLHLEQDKKTMSERTTELRARFDVSKIEQENRLLIEKQEQKEVILQALQRNEALQSIIIALVAVILGIVSIFAFIQVKRKMNFKRLALTDELTQLANRRSCHSQANLLFKHAIKNHTPFSVISFDIDHFKQVNDTWGHGVGDLVLVTLANICTQLMRQSDIIARVGGEEFLIILPTANSDQALEIANRIVSSIANANWQHLTPDRAQTVSAGVVSLSDETTLNQLLIKVDKGLYLAKSSGRNCVRQV
jgi:diguanylate cyclase (GGDEF)-like protein